MSDPRTLTPEQALQEILEIAEDREDVNREGTGPNDWMRVAILARAGLNR